MKEGRKECVHDLDIVPDFEEYGRRRGEGKIGSVHVGNHLEVVQIKVEPQRKCPLDLTV